MRPNITRRDFINGLAEEGRAQETGVTLTSSDGSVQAINAGEAVTILKEWTGTSETDGCTKIWVISSADGSGP